MKTLELIGHVDEQHRLCVEVPADVCPGPVKLIVLLPESDEEVTEEEWMEFVSHQWAAELSDPREDIYTLEDGEHVDGAR